MFFPFIRRISRKKMYSFRCSISLFLSLGLSRIIYMYSDGLFCVVWMVLIFFFGGALYERDFSVHCMLHSCAEAYLWCLFCFIADILLLFNFGGIEFAAAKQQKNKNNNSNWIDYIILAFTSLGWVFFYTYILTSRFRLLSDAISLAYSPSHSFIQLNASRFFYWIH